MPRLFVNEDENILCVKRDGCFWMQTPCRWQQRQLSARPDGSGGFAQRDGGTPWEFVMVHQQAAREEAHRVL